MIRSYVNTLWLTSTLGGLHQHSVIYVNNLGVCQATLVENAYYQCKPPERSAVKRKKRAPQQEYIRHLLFTKLTRNTVEKVLRQLRKLPWPQCEAYIVHCVLKVRGNRNVHTATL